MKWPFFEFFKKQERVHFEVKETQIKTERRFKGYLEIGELISPPELGSESLFFPR